MDELKASPIQRPWAKKTGDFLRSAAGAKIKIGPEETIDFAMMSGKKKAPKTEEIAPVADYLRKTPEFFDNVAYGTPLTKGKGFATSLKDSTKDAMSVGADILPVVGSALKVGAKGAEAASSAALRAMTKNKAATPWRAVDEINQMNLAPSIFAGPKSKTADLGKLDRARMLREHGTDAEAIRKDTGWSQFPDGNWRYEIDDSKSKYNANQEAKTLGEVLDHPELYEAYPHMRDMPFNVKAMAARGAYSDNAGIALGKSEFDAGPSIKTGASGYAKESGPRSVLAHEAQHAVQSHEGNARGGNPTEFFSDIRRGQVDAESKLIKINAGLADASKAGDMNSYNRLLDERQALVPLIQSDPWEVAGNSYRRLAGEAEARLTQRRLMMSKALRDKTDPIRGFDVPPDDQIVRFKENSGTNNEQLSIGEDASGYRRVGSTGPSTSAEPAASGIQRNDGRAVRGLVEDEGARGYRGRPDAAALEEVQRLVANPSENPTVQLAQKIAPGFSLDAVKSMPGSSIRKQMPIAKAYGMLHDTENVDPAIKRSIFSQYLRQMPDVVNKSGATNYGELTEAAYEQLRKETQYQFDAMRDAGIGMSYHNDGRGNYRTSQEMLVDAMLNNHLYTFGGGDIHPGLNAIDKSTGLNSNEMFRAVHDYFGHGTTGSEFGRRGEEIAYGAHGGMFSPLAKIAAGTETRGQNSFVNYSGVNADTLYKMAQLRHDRSEVIRRGGDASHISAALRKAGEDWQYAPQSPFLLPPEMLSAEYNGGMPDYMQKFVRPSHPESRTGYHWSHENLSQTDPSYSGTGIPGAEQQRSHMDGYNDRTYFYNDPKTREPGLGPNQHSADLTDIYNLVSDPEKLGKTTYVENFDPTTGYRNSAKQITDREQAIKDLGYRGYTNGSASAMFYPQVVKHLRKAD